VSFEEEQLRSLVGASIPSDAAPGTSFRIERVLAQGGSAVTFFALRMTASHFGPVVLKVIRPGILDRAEGMLLVRKEAVALSRLGSVVPPTPYVVRVIDTGAIHVGSAITPWIAVEYVHGGYEGTTLTERVSYSVRTLGFAFDAVRASHALRCIGEGLRAVADVGVVHRDLTPKNVLCCGHEDTEVFKLADFGLARASGMWTTFGTGIGTPGYAAPEQCFGDSSDVGPESDVFSLACLAFYVFTSEHYFDARNHAHLVGLVRQPSRRSILDCPHLSPQIASRRDACAAIDRLIASATVEDIRLRPPSADQFVEPVRAVLRTCIDAGGATQVDAPVPSFPRQTAHRWYFRSPASLTSPIHQVAWDGDGCALVATEERLAFWNGTQWLNTAGLSLPAHRPIRLVRRLAPGRFLLGDGGAFLAEFGLRGLEHATVCPDPEARVVDVCGEPAGEAVAAGFVNNGPVRLWPIVNGQWLGAIPLPQAASVTALARWSRGVYLIAGRDVAERGFLAEVNLQTRAVSFRETAPSGALLSIASVPSLRRALVTGRSGCIVSVTEAGTRTEALESAPPLSACALDRWGRGWVASTGALWTRTPRPEDRWSLAWTDTSWDVPFVSLHADDGRLIAMTALGAVLEGQIP
jgi:eukaryotic-like serine/threonine-protein kinase